MKRIEDRIAIGCLWMSSLMVLLFLFVLLGYIVIKGLPVISPRFIFSFPQGVHARGGIFPMIITTFYLTILAGVIVSPIAIGGAVYLTQYAKPGRLVRIIRFGADALSSVPSIVFGLFGLALFVSIFGWSMIAGGLTLALMILPVVMGASEDAILAVPRSFREASFGLGATQWQTIKNVIVPVALPCILTGVILGIGRAFGETAAVFLTAGMAVNLPFFPTEPGRTMTVHLYLLATEGMSLDIAFGTALLLMVFILSFNFLARYLGARRLKGGR
jgi:phosphate transport system permease protein